MHTTPPRTGARASPGPTPVAPGVNRDLTRLAPRFRRSVEAALAGCRAGLAVHVISRARGWNAGEDWFRRVAAIFRVDWVRWGDDGVMKVLPHFQWGRCKPNPSDRARELHARAGPMPRRSGPGALAGDGDDVSVVHSLGRHHTIPARVLGPVERVIGGPNQLLGVLLMLRRGGHAHR